MDFAVPADQKVKLKESEKGDKYLDHTILDKTFEHKTDRDTNYNWPARYNHQKFGTRSGKLGNERTSGDYSK